MKKLKKLSFTEIQAMLEYAKIKEAEFLKEIQNGDQQNAGNAYFWSTSRQTLEESLEEYFRNIMEK